eukprot:711221-Prymnesium_polylepis.1
MVLHVFRADGWSWHFCGFAQCRPRERLPFGFFEARLAPRCSGEGSEGIPMRVHSVLRRPGGESWRLEEA